MRRSSKITRRLPLLAAVGLLFAGSASLAEDWFVVFQDQLVTPVLRSDTESLFEVGQIDTDGFSELVFSLGGEFKERVPGAGTVGAILIPDQPRFDYLLRTEGRFMFPLEVKADVSSASGAIFMAPQQSAKVAFPRYRVYLYNETGSAATVSLYVYRAR